MTVSEERYQQAVDDVVRLLDALSAATKSYFLMGLQLAEAHDVRPDEWSALITSEQRALNKKVLFARMDINQRAYLSDAQWTPDGGTVSE